MVFLFGLDETGKKLKKALKAAGADMSVVRPWLKSYIFVRKNARPTEEHYKSAKQAAEHVLSEAGEMEKLLVNRELLTESDKQSFARILEGLAADKKKLDFEFVISEADKDVHLTMDAILDMGPKFLKGEETANPLILQSEVENLLGVVKDRLNKETPNLFFLACYYLNHKDSELEDMSYTSRLMYVDDIFHKEFAEPILATLETARRQAEAWKKEASETPEKYSGRKAAALLEKTKILTSEEVPEEDTEGFLKHLCIM